MGVRRAALSPTNSETHARGVAVSSHRWIDGLVAALLVVWPLASHAECRATSAEHMTAVVELYTSEGCDSCPPADRWLSAFTRGTPASRAVALAFHVDYWDRLGWVDRFGSARYTTRQHQQAARQQESFVYTPQVLLQGMDFPAWRTPGGPEEAIAAINARPARATIDLSAAQADRGAATVDLHLRIPQPRDRSHATIAVALVQDGLASDIKAGENAGKRLQHARVVRQWRVARPALDAKGEATDHFVLPLPADAGALSVVALAENAETGAVLQAVSLPLCAR